MKDRLKEMTALIQQSEGHEELPDNLKTRFEECCLQVNELLTEKVLANDSEAQLIAFISYTHRCLVTMCNTLCQHPKDFRGLSLLLAPLQQLINAIEDQHTAKLDSQNVISHFNLKALRHCFNAKKVSLTAYFRKHRVDKKLLLVLAKHHQAIQKQQEMSYAQYHYNELLLAELEAIHFKSSRLNSTEQVILLLVRLNFNYLPFMVYCRNLHMAELAQADGKAAKLNVLSAQFKTLRLIQPKPGYAFEPATDSVIEVLSSWILAERVYLETM
ncbi:hypothetical protein [Pedobacter boryungensis]|uniref:Uncharacterized protein n=1 Tax=Pedobacter boryungensis TaxID=869962 RepID=A0ABX2D941_9SPHI|nr:hypothetical protein [Pedobacter boryungensis]NQX30575.1 hypothetical protein [Pedobacter boryungensis]